MPIRMLETLVHALDRLPLERVPAQAEHLATGRAGELAAYFYLRRAGYTIVARDWKSGLAPGDIDLVGWEGETVCFVEVKTRTRRDVATAEAAVDDAKRRTLRRLAGFYIRQLPPETLSRFDVLSIYLGSAGKPEHKQKGAREFELFRGAFDWS